MPKHESRYFVMSLKEILEQSFLRMLAWEKGWKMGIHQSIRQAELVSKKMTVKIWYIWNYDQKEEPVQRVDKRKKGDSAKET